MYKSFPTRERGLKFVITISLFIVTWSFPTRERGLKYWTIMSVIYAHVVVPHAGTWIEIEKIENKNKITDKSFPTRERGLK